MNGSNLASLVFQVVVLIYYILNSNDATSRVNALNSALFHQNDWSSRIVKGDQNHSPGQATIATLLMDKENEKPTERNLSKLSFISNPASKTQLTDQRSNVTSDLREKIIVFDSLDALEPKSTKKEENQESDSRKRNNVFGKEINHLINFASNGNENLNKTGGKDILNTDQKIEKLENNDFINQGPDSGPIYSSLDYPFDDEEAHADYRSPSFYDDSSKYSKFFDEDDYEDDHDYNQFQESPPNYMKKFQYVPKNQNDKILTPNAPQPVPKIDLDEKGCKTVLKEVKEVPMALGESRRIVTVLRNKRDIKNGKTHVTSITMTKECHFPDSHTSSSVKVPRRVSSNHGQRIDFKTSKPQHHHDTRNPQNYRGNPDGNGFIKPDRKWGSIERHVDRKPFAGVRRAPLLTQSSNNRNTGFIYDDDIKSFMDDNGHPDYVRPSMSSRSYKNRKSHPSSNYHQGRQLFPHRNFHANFFENEPIYASEEKHLVRPPTPAGFTDKDPKKYNKSFAYYKRKDPTKRGPNGNDYALTYGRGNFQSFSNNYDSDRDGPLKPSQKKPS